MARSKNRKKSRSRSRSRSKVRIPVRSGTLSKHGYAIHKSPKQRHIALQKACKKDGALAVFRKLNVLAVFNKNSNKTNAAKFIKDRDWVKKNLL